jgi:acetylornithine deacetylase/succinyl-diaminopimelate desuccinylase-like protein
VIALLVAAALAADPTLAPAEEQARLRAVYKERVETNTSYTPGATTPAAEAMAARLRAAGFPEGDVQVVGPAPRKMNLVARYRGTGKRRPLLLLAHLDVVEAKREDWSMDPFVLHEQDGYFYGRGTGDDKAQAAIWIATLLRLRQEGYRPDRDLIVALTADEEGGGPWNGVDWLIANRRDLIDAELCLNEGGWGEMKDGKHLQNGLQVSEKYVANFRLEVKNRGGHSSMPVKDNAIYRLAAALGRVSALEFPVLLNDVTRGYFERMAGIETGPVSADLKAAAAGSPDAQARVSAASPAWNATLRTTCVATQLDGGHALNALPQTAGANVNCRILPSQALDDVVASLKRAIADDQVTLTVSGAAPAPGPDSPLRPDVVEAAQRATDALWPGVPVVPIMVMGATDGRSLRKAGIPTYGIQGIFYETADLRFHGRDERVPVRSLYEGQRFLYDVVKALSR